MIYVFGNCELDEQLYELRREVLDLLIAALVRLPILLLGTARPGFHHTWDDLTYYHRLTVEPLTDEHTDALIHDYFRPYDASTALKALIRERAGGNSLRFEHVVMRHLMGQGGCRS
jgi:predicted ATPase